MHELRGVNNIHYALFIYGGFTEHTIETRMDQHAKDNQPRGCDDSWRSEKVTTYKLTDNLKLDETNISKIENYLINSLNDAFGNRCINSRKQNGLISQLGGNGINIRNNNKGDKIIFYVFYGQLNLNNIFA